MEQITFNPNNEPYYSEDFIKGFKCGAERQFEADKADRPQGEWTHRDSYWHTAICSNCNKLTMFEEWDGEIIEYDFCPNCGCRMKGADDE